MQLTRLIIHADDLGETIEITRGILQAIDAGVVTSTSILANMPGTELALAEAAARGRSASFGVHLNLCEGRPLTDGRSLIQSNGYFHSKRSVTVLALTGRLDASELESELCAQVDRIRSAGVEISHFDSHKHLHQLPGVRDAVLRVAKKFHVSRIRCTLEDGHWAKRTRGSARFSRSLRSFFAKQAHVRFSRAGLRHPGRVFDIKDLMSLQDRAARTALLRRPGVLTEMFCHPGTEEADREKPGSCNRHQEFEFLLSEEFRSLLQEAEVKRTSFWEC